MWKNSVRYFLSLYFFLSEALKAMSIRAFEQEVQLYGDSVGAVCGHIINNNHDGILGSLDKQKQLSHGTGSETKSMLVRASYVVIRFSHNYYHICGDYSLDSNDSRYWGLVPEEYIVGVVDKIIRDGKMINPYIASDDR